MSYGRLDEAELALARAYQLNANRQTFNNIMVDIHNLRGEFNAALQMLESMPQQEFNLVRMAVALHGVGRRAESDEILNELMTVPRPEAVKGVVQIFATRGENDLAFEWLAKVQGIRPQFMVYDGYIRQLKDDPRWRPWVDSLDWRWEYEY